MAMSPFGPLNGRASKPLQFLTLAVGLLAMTVLSMPDPDASVRTAAVVVLWCCLAIYAADLSAKAWPRAGSQPNYLSSAAGIIDLLAVLPIPIALLLGVPAQTAWLLASLWILKLATAVPGLSMLGRVIALEKRALGSVIVIFLTILVLASVALHVLEGPAQPRQFGSLPLSLWWAVTTLSSTGYGDAVPQTFLGRLIAGIVMISGLGVFGLWTGILATGFAAEHRRRDFIRNWDLVTQVPFFKNLDPPTVIELTRMLRRLDLAERTVIVRRGRPGDCMYFIASGEVEVKVEPHPVKLAAGAFFGEMALLTGGQRMANVVTTQPTTLLALEVADFHTLTAHHPELARAVAAEAARRKGSSEKPSPPAKGKTRERKSR